jgi:hypothetical protein
MKVALHIAARPELSPRAVATRAPDLCFKTALADAERLTEQQGSRPSSRPARSEDADKHEPARFRGELADRHWAGRKPYDVLERHREGFGGRPGIRTHRSLPTSSPANASLGQTALQHDSVRQPVAAERGINAGAIEPEIHRIEWSARSMAFEPTSSFRPQSDIAFASAPGRVAPSIAQTLTETERPKDDGQTALAFAEPGVIRPLRCDTAHLDAPVQAASREPPRAAAPPATAVEHHGRLELREHDFHARQRATSPNTHATPRQVRTGRILRFAFVGARLLHSSTPAGATHFAAPDAPAEEPTAPQRASPPKAPPPRITPRTPSLTFREAAGALDVIVGLANATPELRARLLRALDAAAADYGLRIAHMTLNGASVGRASGPGGG